MSIDAAPSKTRDRILFLLKVQGPHTAGELAGELGVTTMAVRQHLSGLEKEGLIDAREERRPVGRPARLWFLTPEADRLFPMAYDELAVATLSALRRTYGEEAVARIIEERTKAQITRYMQRMEGTPSDLESRLKRLVALRAQDGFLSEVHDRGGGHFQFVENHCPVRKAAACCRELCDAELRLFRELLGPDAEIERDEHLLENAPRCSYRVRSVPV